MDELDVKFHTEPECILDTDNLEDCPGGRWLPGACLNAAESCLRSHKGRRDEDIALLWRDEGMDDEPLKSLSFGNLRAKVR